MNIKGREISIDKGVMLKAIGIMALGWLALPIVYVLLIKKEKKEEKKDDGKE